MNPRDKKENLLANMRQTNPMQPVILSVKGLITLLTSRQDKQDFVDVLSEVDPTYVELFDFPNMDSEKNLRAVKALLEELTALRPNSDEVKLLRLHIAGQDLKDDEIESLANHVAKICATHETPDITCETGDKELNSIWNTIFYGLTSGNGMEDVYGSFLALAGEQAAMRKFDDMRQSYDDAISVAETSQDKAQAYYLRGKTYRDCQAIQSGSPMRRLYSLAIQDLQKAHDLWPENTRITADLGICYLRRGIYFTNRGGDEMKYGLADLKKVDAMAAGESSKLKDIISICQDGIEELTKLRQSFQHVKLLTRETMESKIAKKETPLSRSNIATMYGSSPKQDKSGDEPPKPDNDKGGPKGP